MCKPDKSIVQSFKSHIWYWITYEVERHGKRYKNVAKLHFVSCTFRSKFWADAFYFSVGHTFLNIKMGVFFFSHIFFSLLWIFFHQYMIFIVFILRMRQLRILDEMYIGRSIIAEQKLIQFFQERTLRNVFFNGFPM